MSIEEKFLLQVAFDGTRVRPWEGRQFEASLRESIQAIEHGIEGQLTLSLPPELKHLGEAGWPVVAALARDMQLEGLTFSLQASDAVIAELRMRGLDDIVKLRSITDQ